MPIAPALISGRSLFVLLAAVHFLSGGIVSACQDEPQPAESAPVRSIVLFNSGAGQFTHGAKVTGTSSMTLPVPVAKTNDLLKSLAFADSSGGRVSGVRYRTSRDQLDEAADLLRDPLTLAQFLQSQRGQLVSFGTDASAVTGRILGVENRTKGDEVIETLVVVADNGIQARPVSDLDGLKFVDPAVADQLSSGLIGLARDDTAAVNEIEIEFAGEGEREVRFSYIVDMPVWKMSWRLAIDEGKGSLQGWAHIDNDTGADWDDVQLELRSGRPFLFSAAVFEPVITRRPDLGISVFEIPKDTSMLRLSGSTTAGRLTPSPMFGSGGGGFGGGGLGGGSFGENGQSPDLNGDPSKSLEELVQTTINPDSFENAFREVAQAAVISQTIVLAVEEPVSIAAGHSSMVPVFKAEGDAREKTVLAMSMEDFEEETTLRPTRACEIPAIETAQLIAGPVALYRDGVFTGDCVLRRPAPGQPLLLEFGRNVDLLVKGRAMDKSIEMVSAKREGKKNQMTIQIIRKVRMTLQNAGKDTCNLDLEIAGLEGWTATGEGLKQEGGKLVGEIELAAGSSREQEIVLVQEEVSEVTVPGVAARWSASGERMELDESLKLLVVEFTSLTKSIATAVSESSGLESSLQAQIKEQARLTSQLDAAGTESELGKLLADRILAGEQTIADLREKAGTLTAERRALEEKLAAIESQ